MMWIKIEKKWLIALSVLVATLPSAHATPSFARQMKTDCMTCHYQNIPKLNAYGRSFKYSGFTMVSAVKDTVETSEKGGISLPTNLNASFITKARFVNSQTAKSTTEIFDEAALHFGGRVSKHMGASMEFTEGLASGKFIYSQERLGGRIGLSYYMTDALGAFSSTEGYSTGLYRPVRQFENRSAANIFQKLGIGSGAATGLTTYYSGYGIYATVGLYVPAYGNSIVTDGNYKTLARAAYEMKTGSYELSVGAYYLGGDIAYVTTDINASAIAADLNKFDLTSYGLDLQTEGNIGSMPLLVTIAYVLSNTNTADTIDNNGVSIGAQLNIMERVGLKLAYLSYSDNKDATQDENTVSGGIEFNANQNIRLVLEYSSSVINDVTSDKVIFMSHIAF